MHLSGLILIFFPLSRNQSLLLLSSSYSLLVPTLAYTDFTAPCTPFTFQEIKNATPAITLFNSSCSMSQGTCCKNNTNRPLFPLSWLQTATAQVYISTDPLHSFVHSSVHLATSSPEQVGLMIVIGLHGSEGAKAAGKQQLYWIRPSGQTCGGLGKFSQGWGLR